MRAAKINSVIMSSSLVTHEYFKTGRHSDLRFTAQIRLPGFPVAYRSALLPYSGVTVKCNLLSYSP